MPAYGCPLSRQRRCVQVVASISLAAKERSRWPLWSCQEFLRDNGFRGLYPGLEEELVVHDVFLRPILEGDLDLGGSKVGPFLEALEVSPPVGRQSCI